MSLASLVEGANGSFPDRIALVDDDGLLTFSGLRTDARRFAQGLKARGVTEGSIIAIMARNGRGIVLPMIAAGYLGAQAMILNVGSSPEQIKRIISEHGADVLVVDDEYAGVLDSLPTPGVIAYGHVDGHPSITDIITEYHPDITLAHRPKQQPTVIMSSGTYGIPKGVTLPVPRTPKVLGGIVNKIPWRVGGVVQLTASMFHAWGWLNLHLGLATGSTLVTHRYYDPNQAAADCERYKVTGIVSAAVFLRELIDAVDAHKGTIGPLDFIVSSGNAIPPQLVRELIARFGPVVCNFYGSTEHGQISIASGEEMAADPTTAGTPGLGVRLTVFRDDGQEAAVGEEGAVFSSNSMSTMGFLSSRDHADTRDGMIATGDRGYIDASGRLYICGRADDMVIKGGENVFPREVEEFLGTVDGVDDVFVHGIQDDIIARLDAFIVRGTLADGSQLTAAQVRDIVRANLANHNVPDRVYWVDWLPRNDGGKVVPRELSERILDLDDPQAR